MNVRDLHKMLERYPGDMEILNTRLSDYDLVREEDWSVVKAVPKKFYWMRSHPTMSAENMEKEREYLHLRGT